LIGTDNGKDKKMKKKNSKTLIAVAILTLAAFGTNACSETAESATTKISIASRIAAGDDVKTAFEEALQDAVPKWDAAVVESVPQEAAKSSVITETPLDLLPLVSDVQLSYVGKAKSGKEIYSNASGNAALKIEAAIGYWKFVTPPIPAEVADSDKLTDDGALGLADSLFAQLGLPEAERGDYVAVGVGEADMGPDGMAGKAHATARHVRLFREINGLRVWGSHLMATYDLTGKLFRLELRWPTFKLPENVELIDREQAISEIAAKLAEESPAPEESLEVRTELMYAFDEEAAVFSPTLFIYRFVKGEPLPSVRKYSLVDGLVVMEDLGASNR